MKIALIIGRALLALISFVASNKREDAQSNLTSWLPDFILRSAPDWLQSGLLDRYIFWVAIAALALSFLPFSRLSKPKIAGGVGGAGGNAKVGGNGRAIAGAGGGAGPGGSGGRGGDAFVSGNGDAMSGEGGEAGQLDRGGFGGRSPLDVRREMGLWDDGDRKLALVLMLRQNFLAIHPQSWEGSPAMDEWVNGRLAKLDMRCHMRSHEGGFQLGE